MTITRSRMLLLLFLFVGLTFQAHAQYNLKPAVVRLSDGNMIQAFIGDNDNNLWRGNIDLYTSPGSQRERLSPEQVIAININNEKIFYALNHPELFNQRVMVLFDHRGTPTLGNHRGQLFIFSGDKTHILEKPVVNQPIKWRAVLNSFLGDCPDVYPLVRSRGYAYKKLIEIFEQYWECQNTYRDMQAFDQVYSSAIEEAQPIQTSNPIMTNEFPPALSLTDLPVEGAPKTEPAELTEPSQSTELKTTASAPKVERENSTLRKKLSPVRFSIGIISHVNFGNETVSTSRRSGAEISNLDIAHASTSLGVQTKLFLDRATNRRLAFLLNYSQIKTEVSATVTLTGLSAGTYQIGPIGEFSFVEFGLQYFLIRKDHYSFFVQGTIVAKGYNGTELETEDDNTTLSGRLGLNYYPVSNLELTASLGYLSYDYSISRAFYQFDLQGRMPFQIGAAIILPR